MVSSSMYTYISESENRLIETSNNLSYKKLVVLQPPTLKLLANIVDLTYMLSNVKCPQNY